ncbi:class I SAM-dependent methyltransferase [Marvinbryantia formatexigens]|nr:SAM-dependent methyltransferase [Marvinbryantia formatexigens]UWO25664.1 SAM-dependent methyltransferase [Marvinbryantia formatexigens DSM 14469]SDF32609.1 Methyltransferase domain-containing protein [Marvinbryantia formatexigens]
MERLLEILNKQLNEHLLRITVSRKRHADGADKVKIRPVTVKGKLLFQTAVSDGKKEFHKNYEKDALTAQIETWLLQDYRQLNMETQELSVQALVSKKGKASVKVRRKEQPEEAAAAEHNRKKQYLLEEGRAVPFLVDLGVQTPEGKTVNAHYRKFRQINRFLEFVADILPALDKDRELTIIDFGCGKSYLTFAMYYYLHEQQGLDVRMIGLDLKEDVIAHCNQLAVRYGYEKLRFFTGDIASYEGCTQADMVVTLHACDTATDYALEKAVAWNAKVILSVPCCQHELNRQIHSDLMQPVLKYGLIKERMAALLTDAFRAEILEEQGYQVQILEFIDMEHTPKNILIRAVKKKNGAKQTNRALTACMEAWNAQPLLGSLLKRGEEDEALQQENT